jgi:aryl-alcohol dehydrogenase-like predicted oxidoreductase
VPQAEVNKIIEASVETGVNFLDTANVYNDGASETTLGHALKGRMDKFVVATKFNFPRKTSANSWGASRYHMMQAVEQSLQRLQTDHIDLFYCHRWDDTTPIEETLRGLDDFVRMGKVCYIGASLYASWQLAHANVMAELKGWTRFVVLQSEYNMPGSRGESVKLVQNLMVERNFNLVTKLSAWAKDHGRGVNEVAQAWLLAQPSVCSVITGAKRVDHVTSNVKAADWHLLAAELQEIDAMLKQSEI